MTLRELPIDTSTPTTSSSTQNPEAMQALTRELAFDSAGWTPERLIRITELFDELAPEWHTRASEERLRPLRDALRRGDVPTGGMCAEIGSGIGLQTPPLLEHFDFVVSSDLSSEMLDRSARPASVALVRSDASKLPFAASSVDAVVVVNMFLFPTEYARVLRPGGRLIFVSVVGDRTPIYLPGTDVVRALEPVLQPSDAVTSGYGIGTWTVLTKGGS
jgi:SAM-dependent methyltransferase